MKKMFSLTDLSRITNGKTQFIHLLRTKWNKLHDETDVFRYKIDNLQERIEGGYLLQLNPDRSIKRRTPEQIDAICQPFNANKFNFTKATPEECLFSIQNENEPEVHKVLVNISPISKYHALLCPSVDKQLPQVVTADSLKLVLQIMFLAQDRELKIGFNSLCALASVNHLHYHLFLEKNTLPIETARDLHWQIADVSRRNLGILFIKKMVTAKQGMELNLHGKNRRAQPVFYKKSKHLKGSLYCITDYPVPAFCFEVTEESISTITNECYKLLEYLLKNSIAHNILVTRGHNVKVIIWPRKSTSGVKQFTAFNVAVLELSGWFPMYSNEEYDNIQTDGLETELKKWKIDNFQELCDNLIALF